MLIQGQVGQPAVRSISPGANPVMRQGQQSDIIVSELHGRYYEQTYNRNMFTATLTAVLLLLLVLLQLLLVFFYSIPTTA